MTHIARRLPMENGSIFNDFFWMRLRLIIFPTTSFASVI